MGPSVSGELPHISDGRRTRLRPRARALAIDSGRWHFRRMSQLQRVALLLGGFLLACAAQRFVVVSPARADTSTVGWEYACEQCPTDAEHLLKTANRFGPQGWELVSTIAIGYNAILCFKRPLP
jgi:hypothetical protein